MNKFIGREREITAFKKYLNSGKPEFVAVYGRRRVGKTFLIRKVLGKHFHFEVSGSFKEPKAKQLENFSNALAKCSKMPPQKFHSWTEAFFALEQHLDSINKHKKRIVLFIDELPWMDTPKSGFMRALDYFWNHYASAHEEIMLVVCGSATSWMVNNLINDRGGLHNRVTREIHLYPFTLHETGLYMKAAGFKWPKMSIAQAYMILGGIPFYLDLLDKDETFQENIDRLAFGKDAPLKSEYNRLYTSLFGRSEKYMSLINLLSKNGQGLTREEIAKGLGIKSSGNLSQILNDLVNCDFIRHYNIRSNKIKRNSGLYQLTDFFTLFHFAFINKYYTSEHYWSEVSASTKVLSWQGLAFERLCMAHIPQIKKALGISKINTEYFSWRSPNSHQPAQIDLIIERADAMTHVCEMKFSKGEYTITKSEDAKIANRVEAYKQQTHNKFGILTTIIAANGIANNIYSTNIDNVITLNDLFIE